MTTDLQTRRYEVVEKVFEDGWHCSDCPHFVRQFDRHAPGMSENTSYCQVLDGKPGLDCTDCPQFEEPLDEEGPQ